MLVSVVAFIDDRNLVGPYSRPLPISVGPKTSSITLDDEQVKWKKNIRLKLCFKLGIAVNMNLTVTCTNLPPHLCFLSAELVNSLPQISGKTSWFFTHCK